MGPLLFGFLLGRVDIKVMKLDRFSGSRAMLLALSLLYLQKVLELSIDNQDLSSLALSILVFD